MTIPYKTCLIACIAFFLMPLEEIWKFFSGEDVNIWISLNYPMAKDWVVLFFTYKLAPWLLSSIMVIDSRNKDVIKKSIYWMLFAKYSFEQYRFFLNFCKDNYFWAYLFVPFVFFGLIALIQYDRRNDIIFQVKSYFNNWYYNGWKEGHYFWLDKYQPKPEPRKQKFIRQFPSEEPRPRFQHMIERKLSPTN